jgi:hypothetical protein
MDLLFISQMTCEHGQLLSKNIGSEKRKNSEKNLSQFHYKVK